MAPKSNPAATASQRAVVLTRIFDAPRALVFQAWTDPRHVAQWWGPDGFTNPVCELDARRGGAIRIDMRGPDGTVYPMTGVYREVVESERLVFACTALGGDGFLERLENLVGCSLRPSRSGRRKKIGAIMSMVSPDFWKPEKHHMTE